MYIRNVSGTVLSTLAIFTVSFLTMLCIDSISNVQSSPSSQSNINTINVIPIDNNNLNVVPPNNNNNPDNIPANGNDHLNHVPEDNDAGGDNMCPICYEEFDETRFELPCRHRFCRDCIGQWARRTPNPTCPMCRQGFIWND